MHLKEVAARGSGASSVGFLPLNRPPVRRPGTKAPWEPADMTRYDRLAPRARSHVALPVDRRPLRHGLERVDEANANNGSRAVSRVIPRSPTSKERERAKARPLFHLLLLLRGIAAKSQNRKDICHKLTAPLTLRKVFHLLGRNSKW